MIRTAIPAQCSQDLVAGFTMTPGLPEPPLHSCSVTTNEYSALICSPFATLAHRAPARSPGALMALDIKLLTTAVRGET